jgi:hypothetical protein
MCRRADYSETAQHRNVDPPRVIPFNQNLVPVIMIRYPPQVAIVKQTEAMHVLDFLKAYNLWITLFDAQRSEHPVLIIQGVPVCSDKIRSIKFRFDVRQRGKLVLLPLSEIEARKHVLNVECHDPKTWHRFAPLAYSTA